MEKLKKNYFYLGTVLYLVIILLCFAVFNEGIDKLVLKDGMWNTVVHTFRFDNKDQLILNILPFVVVSIFLEKHYGSFNYLFIILLGTPIAALANLSVISWGLYKGLGLLNFYLIGIFLITVIFNFKDYRSNLKRIALPLIVLLLLVLLISWNVNQVLGVKEIKDLLEFKFLYTVKGDAGYANRTALFIGAVVALLSKIMNNIDGESNGW